MCLDKVPDLRKKLLLALSAIIIVVAIGLRSVHHSDWLVFKSDQARDAIIMNQAMAHGITSLPLLGPEAGSTGFHLGPISYYFQYFSGKIFGGTAESFAYPDLVFGVLTIPLLFLLLQRFIPLPLSLWFTALASVSLFLVTFSRFTWNPNSLPFFTTLFALFFLEAIERKGATRRWLLVGAATCAGIIAQLHLVAIAGLLIGLTMFLILSRSLRLREIFFGIAIVTALQFPIFVHEWKTGGENTEALKKALTDDTYHGVGHGWHEKIFRSYQQASRVTWLTVTGQQDTDVIKTEGFSMTCDKKCRALLPYSIPAMMIFGFITVSAHQRWRSASDMKRKTALAFVGLWFAGFFFATVFVAYEIQTRFYLGIIPPLFIFLGIAADCIVGAIRSIWLKNATVAAGIALILINFQATTKYLHELDMSQTSAEESGRDLRFGTEAKVTLGQLRSIADETLHRFPHKDIPILISGESHNVKSMYYVLSAEYGYQGCYFRGEMRDAPDGFNRLFIDERKPSSTDDLIPFGTLGAVFDPASRSEPRTSFPEKCLTY
jgi:4-amino-4-deoxy-L-arabinose transferase-like glycosyltransferase